MISTNNPKIQKFAKVFSDFFNPLTSFFIFFIYYSVKNYSTQQALQKFLPMLVLILIPIIVWIFWNVQKGNYTNADVSDRNQRKSLYFFIEFVLLIYLCYCYFFKNVVDYEILFVFALLVLMQGSNYFIKSSMHTAFNMFTAGLFFSQDPKMGLFWLGITLLVGISRIILKRHSPAEVWMGAFLGFLVAIAYNYFKN